LHGDALITIVDYGAGNIGSVLNMIKKVGGNATASSRPEALRSAKKILLPGVGSFDNAMHKLEQLELVQPLRDCAAAGVPLFGICLGMQLLSDGSEEGKLPHTLDHGLESGGRFYFVHSYHYECEDPADELFRTHYGYDFTSGVQRGNVMGVQFHPEKSHRFGMQLFNNFISL